MSKKLFCARLAVVGCEQKPSPSSEPSYSINAAWTDESLLHDGRTRTYFQYAPSDGNPHGLVVVLHGSGEAVEYTISEIAIEDTADEHGILVVVPAGIDGGWNDEEPPDGDLADDVGFIDALVATAKNEYPSLLDDQFFAHGFSNGGGLATLLACESSKIRGVGVIGNYYYPSPGGCPRPTGHTVPGWFGVGLEDEIVPVESVRDTMSSYAEDLTDCSTSESLETIDSSDVPNGVVCKQLSDCPNARSCEYDDRGHEILPGSVLAAWNYLSARYGSTPN